MYPFKFSSCLWFIISRWKMTRSSCWLVFETGAKKKIWIHLVRAVHMQNDGLSNWTAGEWNYLSPEHCERSYTFNQSDLVCSHHICWIYIIAPLFLVVTHFHFLNRFLLFYFIIIYADDDYQFVFLGISLKAPFPIDVLCLKQIGVLRCGYIKWAVWDPTSHYIMQVFVSSVYIIITMPFKLLSSLSWLWSFHHES